jgi:ribonuclease R
VQPTFVLPGPFPADVLAEARRLGSAIRPADLEARLDCRGDLVVTIDPSDAEDFDDAFSLARDADGGFRARVHVADVAHYVRPGTALDREARRRGNSTYLVDRVVPMLPEALSNGLCSLRPGVDRLTRCVEFRIDPDGRVHGARIQRAVIRSRQRFTYEEALAVLGARPRNRTEEVLHEADALARLRRARRFADGALALDMPEIKLVLDPAGRVLRIDRIPSDPAHQLIEELMLLANEAVATRLRSERRPTLHRVHEEPETERLAAFRQDVRRAQVPCGDLRDRREVARLVERLGRTPAGTTLRIGFLKAMSPARYAVDPLGHYGLAKANYTHFTSPIRRYADLLVHRALDGALGADPAELGRLAEHLSATERNSALAERQSRQSRLLAHLADEIADSPGRTYEAQVARFLPHGCLVDLGGLGLRALCRGAGQGLKIGDPLRVEIAAIDLERCRVDVCRAARRPSRPSRGRLARAS